MTARVQIKRTVSPNLPPTGLLPGELAIEMASPTRLWVGVPTSIDPTGRRSLSSSDTSGYTKSESDTTNAAQNTDIANRVLRAGDMMSGNLTITKAAPQLWLNRAPGTDAQLLSATNGVPRWSINFATNVAESGGDAGSNFQISRYSDAGAYLSAPFIINRSTGTVTVSASLEVVAPTPVIYVNKLTPTAATSIYSAVNGLNRWAISMGNGAAETGGNSGNSFSINSFTDAGAYMATPFTISRGDSKAYFSFQIEAKSSIMVLSAGAGNPNPNISLFNSANLSKTGSIYYDNTNNQTYLWHYTGASAYLQDNGFFNVGGGAAKPGGGVWTATSDARIKTVIGNYDSGISTIKSLQPVRYTYKGNDTTGAPSSIKSGPNPPPAGELLETPTVPYKNSPHYQTAVDATEFIGLIAQDAEAAVPECVSHTDGYIDGVAVTDLRTMDNTPLIFALINAVKELAARVEYLESRSVRY